MARPSASGAGAGPAPAKTGHAGLFPRDPVVLGPGAVHLPGWLDREGQRSLAAACRAWADEHGLRAPRMRNGSVMSVEITCLGWHWFPYRYSRTVDDDDGRAVAPFPDWLGDLARAAVDAACAVDASILGDVEGHRADADLYAPDVALVNWYGAAAKMGMHADQDEPRSAPIVSLSVGDSCTFRFGTPANRGRPWVDTRLDSGDLVVFGGPSRRAYHGVPKVFPGSADRGCGVTGGRFNVTIRETGLA